MAKYGSELFMELDWIDLHTCCYTATHLKGFSIFGCLSCSFSTTLKLNLFNHLSYPIQSQEKLIRICNSLLSKQEYNNTKTRKWRRM